MTNLLMLMIVFVWICLTTPTEANSNKVGLNFAHLHINRRLEDEGYDPGVCIYEYLVASACVDDKSMSPIDFDACMACTGAGQTEPMNPTCAELSCSAMSDCVASSCTGCEDEILALKQCEVTRDCDRRCSCDKEVDLINACLESVSWTGDFEMCQACSSAGQLDPENATCGSLNCTAVSGCVGANCGGCEAEVQDYFTCAQERDCNLDCQDPCIDMWKSANDCSNSDAWTGNIDMCNECFPMCEDMSCEGMSDCVEATCGGCTEELQGFFTCVAQSSCGVSCSSERRLKGAKLTHVSHHVRGSTRHIFGQRLH